MFGTYHFRHDQTDAHLDLVKPQIDAADTVFLEMSQEEQLNFQNAIARDCRVRSASASRWRGRLPAGVVCG